MKILLSLFFSCTHLIVNAQAVPGAESGIFRLEKGTFDSHQLMMGRKLPPADIKGDYYLNSNWQKGSFITKDGRQSATYLLRYDVENALLEIKWADMIKVAGEEYLSAFSWFDDTRKQERFFIHAGGITHRSTAMAGFVELLFQGADSLFVKTGVYLKDADYVPGLDMGRRSPEILHKNRIFVLQQGVATEIKNRRDFYGCADQVPARVLKRFIQKEGIRLHEPSDVRKLMSHYESLKDSKKE